jgi:O-antigen/teichoic acid export membrane protein
MGIVAGMTIGFIVPSFFMSLHNWQQFNKDSYDKTLFKRLLVYLVIGAEYQQTVILLLPWITIALLLIGLQVFYFDLAFQLGDYPIGIVKIGIFIAIANLLLNYWLMPLMEIQGAAIVTISSFALGNVLSFIFGRQYFALPFSVVDFMKIVLATLLMGLCLWGLKDLQGWGWLLVQLGGRCD